ncbi:hypothetical protein JTB14_022305 [Gonioctena quinquepunctata]|nr:hypothetical protein JTB14_022305 [Gonioctena quinquepunctata]
MRPETGGNSPCGGGTRLRKVNSTPPTQSSTDQDNTSRNEPVSTTSSKPANIKNNAYLKKLKLNPEKWFPEKGPFSGANHSLRGLCSRTTILFFLRVVHRATES